MASFCLQVVNDFFPNPDTVRKQALATAIDVSGNNPGQSSANVDVAKNMNRVGRLLKIQPDYAHLKNVVMFRMTRGSERIKDTDIHADGPIFAGVCYLNLPDQCSGGTTFFKHKETGLEAWPTKRQVANLIARGKLPPAVKREEELDHFWDQEGSDRSKWEPTLHVPMVYNRALFYNGNQFHTMTSWTEFGDTKETARLTQVFFFHEA